MVVTVMVEGIDVAIAHVIPAMVVGHGTAIVDVPITGGITNAF